MSPAQFNDINPHANKELSPSPSISSSFPLKINKDSHFIKKSSSSSSSPSSSSSSSTSSLVNGVVSNATNKSHHQQRHPVIIYTHSPKIIHTHPKDFMALVQKLTGLSRSDEDDHPDRPNNYNNHKLRSASSNIDEKIDNGAAMAMSDDNESTSVVTEDNNSGTRSGGGSSGSAFGEAQVNSGFVPRPMFDPAAAGAPNPCFNGIPFFNPGSTDFLGSSHHHHTNQPPFNYNYSEDSSLFYMPNIRSSLSSSTLEGMKELPDF
ncbi:OLC1v1014188C1 [Oldenlandia corymbosa var. corymbosa]|uniref:OLC1v1014188C1 n=1 Tax=Oldenlandia corymbosa var. corymbosa TaxID=529605 RepID=A0AAV1E3N9_OLDCO|nr:OLC1v1014188C1 [Oldenlandia corymbosa var. corymbosa]